MGGRHNGDGGPGDVYAKPKAGFVNGRKTVPDELCGFVGDIQMDALCAGPLHFGVDGACDDVARRQFGAGIAFEHEAFALLIEEARALAADGFGNQK